MLHVMAPVEAADHEGLGSECLWRRLAECLSSAQELRKFASPPITVLRCYSNQTIDMPDLLARDLSLPGVRPGHLRRK